MQLLARDHLGVFRTWTARVLLAASLSALPAVAHAVPITLSITSTSSSLGSIPSGPLAGVAPLQTIDLAPNVPGSYAYNYFTNYVLSSGFPISTGATTTVVQTVIVNGVATDITRTLTLQSDGTALGTNCPANILASPQAQITADLGPVGKVDVTLPQVAQAGEECNNNLTVGRGVVVIPGTLGTLLLHDVPPVRVPEASSLLLIVTGLAGIGLYASRSFARSREILPAELAAR